MCSAVVPSLPALDFPHPSADHPLFPYMVDFLRRTASPGTPPPPPPLPPRLPPRNTQQKQDEVTTIQTEPIKKKPAFYLRLSVQTLSCLSGLLCSQNERLTDFVQKKLGADHVSCLACLLRMVTHTQLGADLLEVLHSLVMRGVLGEGLQGLLLRELELNPKCWPLQVRPLSHMTCMVT